MAFIKTDDCLIQGRFDCIFIAPDQVLFSTKMYSYKKNINIFVKPSFGERDELAYLVFVHLYICV